MCRVIESEVEATLVATILDSSVGVDAQVLNAATGSGDTKFFANTDVASNDATLGVQAGESLNGVTDGTFYFSSYADGTQFVATDIGIGQWVVAVEGASTSTDLSYMIAAPSVDISIDTLDSTTNLPIEITVQSSGTDITNNGDGSYTLKAGGRYKLVADLAWTVDGGEVINPNMRWYNVTTSSFFGSESYFQDFA